MYAITMQNEAMDLKKSGERYMGRFDGRKGKGETLQTHYKIRKESTQDSTIWSPLPPKSHLTGRDAHKWRVNMKINLSSKWKQNKLA